MQLSLETEKLLELRFIVARRRGFLFVYLSLEVKVLKLFRGCESLTPLLVLRFL